MTQFANFMYAQLVFDLAMCAFVLAVTVKFSWPKKPGWFAIDPLMLPGYLNRRKRGFYAIMVAALETPYQFFVQRWKKAALSCVEKGE